MKQAFSPLFGDLGVVELIRTYVLASLVLQLGAATVFLGALEGWERG